MSVHSAAESVQQLFAQLCMQHGGIKIKYPCYLLCVAGKPFYLFSKQSQAAQAILAQIPYIETWKYWCNVFIRLALRGKLLTYLPQILKIEVPLPDWDYFGLNLQHQCVPFVYFNQNNRDCVAESKAVVSLFTWDSKTAQRKAILKVPFGILAQQDILHEAQILKTLNSFANYAAPQLLYVNEEIGISMQTALTGNVYKKFFDARHQHFLEQLQLSQTTQLPQHLPLLQERIASLTPELQMQIPKINIYLELLSQAIDFPAVISHGDFSPYNIFQSPTGPLAAFDWEYATFPGLPLVDAISYIHAVHPTRFGADLWHIIQRSSALQNYCKTLALSPKLQAYLYLYYAALKTIFHARNYTDTKQISYWTAAADCACSIISPKKHA